MDFVACSWRSIAVYWYGLTIAAALIAGLAITKLYTLFYREDFMHIIEMMVWSVPCSIIGARIVYVWQHFAEYQTDLGSVFAVWQGGLSIYGALLGFLIVVIWYTNKHCLAVWQWLDIMLPAIIFGIMILQIANFLLQFSIGMPVGLDVPNDHRPAEYIEYKYRPSGFEQYQYFQPVAFYQGAVQFLLFIVIAVAMLVNKRWKIFADGTLFLVSIFWLAFFRFCFGFMYLGMNEAILPSGAQWVAIFVMGAAVVMYGYKRYKYAER